jgi:hypothetical protein
LVTRQAWDAVGGFDERFSPAYFEDVDLCLALAERGLRTRYEPRARVVHRGSQSTSSVYREFLLTRNQQRLVQKWGRSLDRFEPRPPKDSGSAFEIAVGRAVVAAASRRPLDGASADTSAASADRAGLSASTDPLRWAETVQAEYQAYLEQRVSERDQRVTTLEAYLSGLWGVRVRRWVGGRLARRRI